MGQKSAKITDTEDNLKFDVPIIKNDELKVISKLKSGKSGDVELCLFRYQKVVVKRIPFNDMEFRREVQSFKQMLFHENIIRFHGVVVDSIGKGVVMEYAAGGSLGEMIQDAEKEISLMVRLYWIVDIAKGLFSLHQDHIIHRDIALRNILLCTSVDNQFTAKICDFGWSVVCEDDIFQAPHVNSAPWRIMAPESLIENIYSKASDVWSLGVSIYCILVRRRPYEDVPQSNIKEAVSNGLRLDIEMEEIPIEIRPILSCIFFDDPSTRPTVPEIIEHITGVIEELSD